MADSDIGPDEMALVNDVLRSRALSCGPMIDQFEREWAERLGVAHAVAVSSGTAGLHLSMIAAGVTDDDMVVTSPYSFVASANAVLYQRAVPLFVDIDPDTLNIDPEQVEDALDAMRSGSAAARRWLPRRGAGAARPARAVLPVHVFGRAAEMDRICRAASAHDARVIEDACEAVGTDINGRQAGTFGDAAVFGFFPNKQVAMGEGGVITTPHAEWAALFRSLRNQGRNADGAWLAYGRLGYNYRLNDMSAAVGLAQLRRLDDLLARRDRVAARYTARLESLDGVTPLRPLPGSNRVSWFVYVVRFADDVDRDQVIAFLAERGIPSRPYFPSIHLQPFYRERFGFREGDFPHSEAASRSTLALPFHPNQDDDVADYVSDVLHEAMRTLRGTAPRQTVVSVATPPTSEADTAPLPRVVLRAPVRIDDEALIDAFLPRRITTHPTRDVEALFGGRRVLVTGAGGSIGSELCRQIAAFAPASLVMVDRYENGLFGVSEELADVAAALPLIGDITDAARLDAIFTTYRPEVVLHAAAHKHVPLMERNPCEAIKNNITGTRLVLEASVRAQVERFVLISTDKAVRPLSVMGASKCVAERLVQRASLQSGLPCVAVRFGNVIGSNGSVLHTFLAQVRAGGPVTVTDPDVRRFFMRIPDASRLVLHAAAAAPPGHVAVLDLGEQIPVVDLARHVIDVAGDGRDIPLVFTGLRPGEKLGEELVDDEEQREASGLDGINWVRPLALDDWNGFSRDLARLEEAAAAGDADAARAGLHALAGMSRVDQAVV